MADAKQYCTFTLDDLYFGVEVRHVQEVVRYQEMTRVPLAPPEIRGLINLRGQIVTAVDLRHRVGLPERKDGRLPMNVVLRRDDGATSLLVDAIGDVIEVEDETYEQSPETLDGPGREMIRGAFKLANRLLLVLDTNRVLDVPAGE